MSTYPRTGLQRILAGSVNPNLRVALYDQDGIAATPTGTLTCTITRADGTVVATDRATAGTTADRTCALTTAEASTLDVLQAVWKEDGATRATTYHRIVGSYLFPLAALAARAGVIEDFDRAEMIAVRDRATDMVESVVGVAFCPSYDLDQRHGPGKCEIVTHRPLRGIRSMTLDGATISTTSMYLDKAAGIIDARFTVCGWMTLGVEHGFDAAPTDLVDAAVTYAADSLQRPLGIVSRRARTVSDGLGVTQQFGWAGPGHPTGIDDVDAVLMRYAADYNDPPVG